MKVETEEAVWPPAPLRSDDNKPVETRKPSLLVGVISCLLSVIGMLLIVVPAYLAPGDYRPGEGYFGDAVSRMLMPYAQFLLLLGFVMGVSGWNSKLGKVGAAIAVITALGSALIALFAAANAPSVGLFVRPF